MKKKKPPQIKHIQDNPTIRVKDNDIGFAINLLNRRVGDAQIFRTLKNRKNNPVPSARKRAKALRALKRRARQERYDM